MKITCAKENIKNVKLGFLPLSTSTMH